MSSALYSSPYHGPWHFLMGFTDVNRDSFLRKPACYVVDPCCWSLCVSNRTSSEVIFLRSNWQWRLVWSSNIHKQTKPYIMGYSGSRWEILLLRSQKKVVMLLKCPRQKLWMQFLKAGYKFLFDSVTLFFLIMFIDNAFVMHTRRPGSSCRTSYRSHHVESWFRNLICY